MSSPGEPETRMGAHEKSRHTGPVDDVSLIDHKNT